MISTHLPVLQVVIPLLSAPLCAVLPRGNLAWILATATSWVAFLISAVLLNAVLKEGAISYALGGWSVPWGIEYRIDALNAFVLFLVTGIGAVVTPYARLSVAREIPEDRINLFYAIWLLCLTGMLGINITGDAFNVFVFLEIASLSSYALIGMGSDRRALTAAYHYLVLGTIGATFILIGIGLLYMMTGTLNMADLAERLPPVIDKRTTRAAFAFLTVGISIKLALFPLHLWLPNAYTYAPSAVSAFLAATATKVALYILLRFFFTVFGPEFSFVTMRLDMVLLPLSVLAVLAASAIAIYQMNIKRLLAYSSLAQIGYMTLGVSLASVPGLMAAILHLFNHALMKGALFLAVGCIMYRIGDVTVRGVAGLGRRMPWTMGAFLLGGLSLIGVPLTVGFISKWYLILAVLEQGWWPIALVVVIGTLLAIIYLGRVFESAWMGEPEEPERTVREAPLGLLIPTWLLIAANVYFGIHTSLTVTTARRAAEWLLGSGS